MFKNLVLLITNKDFFDIGQAKAAQSEYKQPPQLPAKLNPAFLP